MRAHLPTSLSSGSAGRVERRSRRCSQSPSFARTRPSAALQMHLSARHPAQRCDSKPDITVPAKEVDDPWGAHPTVQQPPQPVVHVRHAARIALPADTATVPAPPHGRTDPEGLTDVPATVFCMVDAVASKDDVRRLRRVLTETRRQRLAPSGQAHNAERSRWPCGLLSGIGIRRQRRGFLRFGNSINGSVITSRSSGRW